MNTLTDVFGDTSYKKFMKIASEVQLPDFVKTASLEADGYNFYSSNVFGDPAGRKYPLNNKSNTWISREFFAHERGNYTPDVADVIDGRIQKAAAFWKLEEPTKIKAPDDEYHPVSAVHGEKVIFSTKISKQGHFKEAAEYLAGNKSKMTYDMRRSFARDLLNTPEHLKCELDSGLQEYIEKAAGFGMATQPRLITAIQRRVVHVYREHPELSEKLVKMAQSLKEIKCTPTTLHKVAGMLDIVDRAVELHRFYDQGHKTPEEDVFSIVEKTAKAFTEEALRLQSGNIISKTALINKKAAVDEFFENYMGEVPYSSDSEMLDVVASLPRNDASALEGTVDLKGMTL